MMNNNCKDEIIRFVMNSSDSDNFIIATFIAGMQATKSVSSNKNDDDQPCDPPEHCSA